MKKNLLHLVVPSILLSLIIFLGSFSVSFAAATATAKNTCVTAKLSMMLMNGQVSPTNSIKISELSNYQLGVNIQTGPHCNLGSYNLKYDINEDSNGSHAAPVETKFLANNIQLTADYGNTFSLTDIKQVPYRYSLIVTTGLGTLTVPLDITYTDDSGNTDPNAAGVSANNSTSNVSSAPQPMVVPPKISDPFKGQTLLAAGLKVIDFLLAMIVIAAVVVIVIAGFRMITGGSNPSQIATAKKSILWAVIGIAVAFLSFAIVAIIQNLL